MKNPCRFMKQEVVSNLFKCFGIIALSTLLAFSSLWIGLSSENIFMTYILGLLIISLTTYPLIYSIGSSVISILVYNYFFIEPRYSLIIYEKDYLFTFIFFFIVTFLTQTLANRLKMQAANAEKQRLRADLLRSISHDLRTPLTSISGNAGNLVANEDKFDERTKQKMYADIYEDSMWLIEIMENLLAVTKMEDKNMNFQKQAELLDEIVEEALRHISREKSTHNISYLKTEELILVKVDARLIMQVVINIVNNAIKYTQDGSDILITTKADGDHAIVSIADNGPGVPDEIKPQIFEMFYIGTKKNADSRRSLGLGLFLCKSIVEAHGGTLKISDHDPHGAVFTFTLPLEEVDIHE